MPNVINEMLARELKDTFRDSRDMVIVSLDGLSVKETEELRTSLAEHDVRLRVVRNRVARLALRESGFEPPEGLLAGPLGICAGAPEDAINAARAVSRCSATKAGKAGIRGGVLEGNFLGAEEASALAGLPTRDELRAKILGCVSGPAQKLVRLLNAPQGALARVVQARIDAGGEAAEEA